MRRSKGDKGQGTSSPLRWKTPQKRGLDRGM
jgi:hypothetical protein